MTAPHPLPQHEGCPFTPEMRHRLEADCSEAERAFARLPKGLWATRSYLAPETTKALRALLDAAAKPDGFEPTWREP